MQQTLLFDEYVNEATELLKDQGLTVKWGYDFDMFNRIVSRHNERYVPAKGFNSEYCDMDKVDGLWLVAFRGSSELVHTQACKKVTILPNMKQHLQCESSAYEPDYLKFDLNNMEVCLSPDASQITGEVVYHGEAWLKGGPAGIRGGSALTIFSRMMIAKALSHWGAKYVFGLITPLTGIKGLAQRYGYTRCEQGAITFLDQPVPNDLWLVWMTAEEAKSQLRLSPKYFDELMASAVKKPVGKVA